MVKVDLGTANELLARPTAWLFGNEAHGLGPEHMEDGRSGSDSH